MFKTLSAKRRGRRSGAEPGEASPQQPITLAARAHAMRREPTEAEDKLWQYLRASRLDGYKFRQQVKFENLYIADFVCFEAMLIIEADGSQHCDNITYDEARTAWFERKGFRVLRFWNNDILFRINETISAIQTALNTPLPTAAQSPSPLRREG